MCVCVRVKSDVAEKPRNSTGWSGAKKKGGRPDRIDLQTRRGVQQGQHVFAGYIEAAGIDIV
jgi:hypothetical protein